MEINNGDCLHVMLYGTFKENRYFLKEYRESFDLIAFNANIIAHAPESMGNFIASLRNKNYFIDPQTHAFQQPTNMVKTKKDDTWVLKKSIEKLAKQYGPLIESKAGIARISPSDFTPDNISILCKNVINFQLNSIKESLSESDEKELLQHIGEDVKPLIIIAPYLYIEPDNFEAEININGEFINKSMEIVSSFNPIDKRQVYAEIILAKEVLYDNEKQKEVLRKYTSCNADGFIIWIDEFSETKVSQTALHKYIDFLKQLERCKKPIINMHGSFFSIALASKAIALLAGVGHGIEYGENRPVIPVGGGVPLAKFYFPRFYERVRYDPDATNIILEMDWIKDERTYFRKVCPCNTCKNIIKDKLEYGFQKYGDTKISEKNGKAYPTSDALDLSRKHYLNTKILEYEYCKFKSKDDIIGSITENEKEASKIKSYSFTHLPKWSSSLSDI